MEAPWIYTLVYAFLMIGESEKASGVSLWQIDTVALSGRVNRHPAKITLLSQRSHEGLTSTDKS